LGWAEWKPGSGLLDAEPFITAGRLAVLMVLRSCPRMLIVLIVTVSEQKDVSMEALSPYLTVSLWPMSSYVLGEEGT
jgi:hypothetical protein